MFTGFAGRNKNGNKNELQFRALELVQIRSTPIQAKIKELYKESQQAMMNQGGSGSQNPYMNYMNNMNMYAALSSLQGRNPYTTGSGSGYPQMPSVGAPSYGNAAGYPMNNPVVPAASHHVQQIPRHPDVKFIRLPFYDIQSELVRPLSMVATTSSRFQEMQFQFLLTPQQATDIGSNRDISVGMQHEYLYQVSSLIQISSLYKPRGQMCFDA